VAYKKDALSDESDTKEIKHRESKTVKNLFGVCAKHLALDMQPILDQLISLSTTT
jgi:hypothetical protein